MRGFLLLLFSFILPQLSFAESLSRDDDLSSRWRSFSVLEAQSLASDVPFFHLPENAPVSWQRVSLGFSYQDETCETCFLVPEAERGFNGDVLLGIGDAETLSLGLYHTAYEAGARQSRLRLRLDTNRFEFASAYGFFERNITSGAYEFGLGASRRQPYREIIFRDIPWQVDLTGDLSLGFIDEACVPLGGCQAMEGKLSLGLASDGAEYGGSLKSYFEYRTYSSHQYDTDYEFYFATKPNVWWRPKQGPFVMSLWGEIGGFRLDNEDNYREDLAKIGLSLGYDFDNNTTISGYVFTRYRLDQSEKGLSRSRVLNGVSVTYSRKF